MSHDDVEGRIFVGGLDHNCDEAVLQKTFSMFGEITAVLIMKDRETNRSRGFGFISFQSQSSADDAISRMHGVEVMGRCVTVRKAEKQANMPDRPRRGGFRGGHGGGDRFGGRSDSKYEPRGFSDGRKSSDGFHSHRGFSDPRGRDTAYGDSRRGGFDTARLGYRHTFQESRGGGYEDNRRSGGYGEPPRSSGGYGEARSPGPGYDDIRSAYPDKRYSDSYNDEYGSRGTYGASTMSRGAYEPTSSSKYETSYREKSRSPIGRYNYRGESPVMMKSHRSGESSFGREYSPDTNRRATGRDYAPQSSSSSRRGNVSSRDNYSVQESRSYAEPTQRGYSPPSRGRARESYREPSPEGYPPRSRGRASPPRERSAYSSSHAAPHAKSPVRKTEYASTRSHESSSARGGRYPPEPTSGREYQSRAANGQDRGAGSRSSYGSHGDVGGKSRYASARPSPPISSRSNESYQRVQKRSNRRSMSPDVRSRRY